MSTPLDEKGTEGRVQHNADTREYIYIDLWDTASFLWRGKWVLLGFVVVFALVAGALSLWVLPRQYQASASVSVQFPRLPSTISVYLPAPYTSPTLASLANALRSDAVLQQVTRGEGLSVAALRAHGRVATIGRDELRFIVRDSDPQRAARLVNRWVELVEPQAYALYNLDFLEARWKALEEAKKEEYTAVNKQIAAAESDLAVAAARWEQVSQKYSCAREHEEVLQAVQAEIAHLIQDLSALDGEQVVPPEQDARVWALVAQNWGAWVCASASTGTSAWQSWQATTASLSLLPGSVTVLATPPAQMTAQEAVGYLQQKQETISSALKQVEAQRAEFARELETVSRQQTQAQDRMQELQDRRSAVWDDYARLKDQSAWFQNMRQKGALVFKVQKAVPPTTPVFPRPLFNVVVGALLGFVFGGGVLTISHWWSGREKI